MTSLFIVNHPERPHPQGQLFQREAVRAVIADGANMLMLYTRRYNDYSFPGGGVSHGEAIDACLLRELQEETGAAAIDVKRYLGYVDEFRPDRRDSPNTMLMRSHFYECAVERVLGRSTPEDYEVANGMVPVWVNARVALEHNEMLLRTRPQTMGLSIYRETQMLRYVLSEH